MTILIFSCNRALQLQTLLQSLATHLLVEGPTAIHVLYAADNERYQAGYELVAEQYPHVQFYRERQQRNWAWPQPFSYWKNGYRYLKHAGLRRTSDFKALTEQIIANSSHEGIMFLTDDSLFTRAVSVDADRLSTVLTDELGTFSLSLRHGLTLRPLPPDVQPSNGRGYVWQIRTGQPDLGHWTWRFSVDGHLYPRRALLPILRRLHYANPNSLEGFVNDYIRTVRPALFNALLFDEQPSLVGFILNKVQTYNGNQSFNVSPAYLNEKLLAGFRLRYLYQEPVTDFQPDLDAIELTNTNGECERLTMGM